MRRFEEKIAVVTGGGSGIGEAIVRRFASEGAQVAIIDRDLDNSQRVADDIGKNAKAYSCDVSDNEMVHQCFETINNDFGQIDILVNNAGVACIGKLEDTTIEDFDRVMNVNVKGVFNAAQAAVKRMKDQGGSILNMASIVSEIGIPDRLAYSTSKGAVLSMTYSIACDYLKEGIRCNAIMPARIHTPFVDNYIKNTYPGQEKEMFEKLSASQPIGRMGTPAEVAGLAAYLCSDEASFITGTAYALDGGFIKLNP
jgi:2-keto-3-deoxy-L-fuconate dehydrogenase